MNRYVVLGTAGHIDHGKSTLVKALTGTDPDRLKEEKERGITIDLGFAVLNYPEGLKVGIVDVPGHERLIKNMLAGAGGIDIVLMVIAADEGIMPQSREHLDICNLLNVKRGLIAVTKSDLVDKEWLELLEDDIRNFVKGTFLESAGIVNVSSTTGHNIDQLIEAIKEIALNVEPKSANGIFRLPVDRIFTLKGFGTVVTGTAVSGSISVDKPVEILPSRLKTKVRGLQSHGETLKTAYAGQRVAINLQGVSTEEIQRGDVITVPDKMTTTSVIDADLEILKDASIPLLKSRSLVHFHTGTTEQTGRIVILDKDEVKPGEKAFCQFRFKTPITLMAGDRYIIRRFSPLLTIGGGEILDTLPKRQRREEKLKELEIFETGDLKEKLARKIYQGGLRGVTLSDLSGWIQAEAPEISRELNSLTSSGDVTQCEGKILHKDVIAGFSDKAISALDKFHKENPLKPGMPKETLRSLFMGMEQKLFEALLGLVDQVVIEKEILRLKTFKISLGEDKKAVKDKILKVLEASAFQPPSKDDLAKKVSVKPQELNELLRIMASEKSLVRITDAIFISVSKHSFMIDSLRKFFSSKPEMTVGEFRDLLGTSRKYALPLLEYLDSNRITLRVGEVRKLLRK